MCEILRIVCSRACRKQKVSVQVSTFVGGRLHGDRQRQTVLRATGVLHFVTLRTLYSVLHLEFETVSGVYCASCIFLEIKETYKHRGSRWIQISKEKIMYSSLILAFITV